MPLPLLPALLIATSVAAGGKGLYDAHGANKKRKDANARKAAAERKLDASIKKTESAHTEMSDDYARMVLVQMSTKALLEDIVVWLEKGRVSEQEWAQLSEEDRPSPVEWRTEGLKAEEMVREVAKVAAAGSAGQVAKAAAVRFGVASTGAAISGLSGAAARSATLAYLGGGSLAAGGGGVALGSTVLSSLNVGAGLFAAGMVARKVAAKYDASVADFEALVTTEVAQHDSQRRLWDQFRRRFHQLRKANNAIARATRRLLDEGDPTDDHQWLAMVHLGKAISTLSRYSPLDDAGRLSAEWTNPYELLAPFDVQPTDEDYIAPELA